MILLGYDIRRQVTLARYQDVLIVCDDDHPRAREILNGLCAVAQNVPEPERESVNLQDDLEAVLIITTPWVKAVTYSDQAWSDLLLIQKKE